VRHNRLHRGERGVVLLLALVALLLIAAVGAAIIFMASSESAIVGAQRVGARSFYASAGGLEEVRYRIMTSVRPALGGLNYNEPLNPANNTEPFARLPAIPPPGISPSEILYVINVPNPSTPGNFDVVGSVPPVTEDPSRTGEVPFAATFRGVASIQPAAGDPNRSVQYQWIRVNLKTEVAAQQDINLDGLLDEDPIFLFMGRQYRAGDLAVYDFDGPGPGGFGFNLPPPWGPDPIPQGITDRPCVAVICASPVYMLTARAQVPLPGSPPTSRLIRSEVAVPFAFSIDAAILSEPGITVNGAMYASGRDICDTDCDLRADATPYSYAGTAGFNSRDTSDVPIACNFLIPMQSEAPEDAQTIPNVKAISDPKCTDLGPGDSCFCAANSCVQGDALPKYDLDQLISVLRPMARVLQEGPVGKANNYYPQIGTSNLNCDASGCQGQGLELGGFPFVDPVAQTGADVVNGANADPIVTYVPGDFKCTSTCTGAGILIVDGDFEMNASMSFYGVVLVRGDVKVAGKGSAPTPCNIYGSIITRGGVSTDLGGSICFQYNSCAQRNASFFAPTLNLSFREMPQ